MKKLFLSLTILSVAFMARADEGMWLLKELNRETIARMQELGFTFPADQLYSEQHASLKDAVVIFGGGCTGVAVSEEGLVFTNHHCGYGAIQKLSAVEHDYLRDGFAAANKSDELYADGLTVSFLRSMEDVTERIAPHLPSVLNEIQRELTVDSISNELIREYENDPFTRARVVPFLPVTSIMWYCTMCSVMYAWWWLPPLRWASLAVIPITGCGPVIRVTFRCSVCMPTEITVQPITVATTSPIVPDMWYRYHWPEWVRAITR